MATLTPPHIVGTCNSFLNENTLRKVNFRRVSALLISAVR